MKTRIKTEEKNLQTPGNTLSDKELEKIVKTAAKGPFITLEEQNKRMNKWIQENSR
ncbi:MAG: hypothetical protein PHF97_11565 [Bacteroidales bacterium]|nr:hypothetical protein [Bacteroidales bacterium]